MLRESKYQSEIFRDFKTLNMRNYHNIVRFYEERKKDIEILNFKEAFILELHYCNALFETGTYHKLLPIADEVIELSIFNNIKFYHGEDIYQRTLFQKAQALFHSRHFDKAEYILGQLISMNPDNKKYSKFLEKCFLQSSSPYLRYIQAAGTLLFFISLGVIVINILVVQSFYPNYGVLFSNISQVGFIMGLSILGLGLLIHIYLLKRRVRKAVDAAITKRNSKPTV